MLPVRAPSRGKQTKKDGIFKGRSNYVRTEPRNQARYRKEKFTGNQVTEYFPFRPRQKQQPEEARTLLDKGDHRIFASIR